MVKIIEEKENDLIEVKKQVLFVYDFLFYDNYNWSPGLLENGVYVKNIKSIDNSKYYKKSVPKETIDKVIRIIQENSRKVTRDLIADISDIIMNLTPEDEIYNMQEDIIVTYLLPSELADIIMSYISSTACEYYYNEKCDDKNTIINDANKKIKNEINKLFNDDVNETEDNLQLIAFIGDGQVHISEYYNR